MEMTMTSGSAKAALGDFTLWGFARDPQRMTQQVAARLGVTPTCLTYGNAGCLFFYTTYGEVAESEEAVALKLGFLRAPTGSPLSAQQLLQQHSVTPADVSPSTFRGNALVACLSKQSPTFMAFKTLLAVPQLYYAAWDGGLLCSERLRCVVDLLDEVAVNEAALPMHFLFRSVPGALTYIRGVERLLPGHLLRWHEGASSVRQLQDLRFADSDLAFTRGDAAERERLYETLDLVLGDYMAQIEAGGQQSVTLLSGGVDSSLMQTVINQHAAHRPVHTFSFAPQAPSFEFEIAYAREASAFFRTEHTFVDFRPEAYAGLLTRTFDILAQPPVLATEPSILSVAEHADTTALPARYFFSGQAADALFGLSGAARLKALHWIGKIPAAAPLLRGLSGLLRPLATPARLMAKGAAILDSRNDPDAFISPVNTIAVYSDVDRVRRCFGDQAVREALAYRRALADTYLQSTHYLERVLEIDLLTDAYEVASQRHQLFLAHHREQPHPFLDEDMLRVGFAFPPDVRYIRGFEPKYLLKKVLYDKTGYSAAWRRKGFSVFEADWYDWMRSGPLAPLVQDIRLPGFMQRAEFDALAREPDYFLWGLLLWDLLEKRVLRG
jgi:asparagine synthetase B (glutamine-hydrolysing)